MTWDSECISSYAAASFVVSDLIIIKLLLLVKSSAKPIVKLAGCSSKSEALPVKVYLSY